MSQTLMLLSSQQPGEVSMINSRVLRREQRQNYNGVSALENFKSRTLSSAYLILHFMYPNSAPVYFSCHA